ncbi:MAG: PEPxxWA-CTERM sorting domain-containing protein [Sphingomonadaceae bacterium]
MTIIKLFVLVWSLFAISLLVSAHAARLVFQGEALGSSDPNFSFVLNEGQAPDSTTDSLQNGIRSESANFRGFEFFRITSARQQLYYLQFGSADVGRYSLDFGQPLFTGSIASPVFSLGTFQWDSNRGLGFLTISRIADTAVPEPSTWVIMLVGFAFTGGAMRRTRRLSALRPVHQLRIG